MGRFVNLHVHSNGSIGDAIGQPKDIFETVMANGDSICALTDHGNMNMFANAYLWLQEHNKKDGKPFKIIYGVEAYFIDDVKDWEKLHKASKDAGTKTKKAEEEDEIVEDESEKTKKKNPLNKRSHLVLLTQNETGLKNLFKLVSISNTLPYYYRYPRIDFELLKEHSEGIVALSACMGGVLADCYWECLRKSETEIPDSFCIDKSIEDMCEKTKRFQEILGKDKFFLELQWNHIPEQHIINHCVLQVAERLKIKEQLVSTADAHYPRKDLWQSRELYKRLARMGKSNKELDPLPEKKEQVPYDLYPKSEDEMLVSFYQTRDLLKLGEYDEKVIQESIYRTKDIAERYFQDVLNVDTSVKFPQFLIPEGTTDIQFLSDCCWKSLKEQYPELYEKKEYQDRLAYELSVVEKRNFASYFILMREIAYKSKFIGLSGTSRGSAGGSLISYLVGITQVDPIRFGLLFERFLDIDGSGNPDIDCIHSEHLIRTMDGARAIRDVNRGDLVYDSRNELRKVLWARTRMPKEGEQIYGFLVVDEGLRGWIVVSEKHKMLLKDGQICHARDIEVGDFLMGGCENTVVMVEKIEILEGSDASEISLTDIAVEMSSTFQLIPFDAVEIVQNNGSFFPVVTIYIVDNDTGEKIKNATNQRTHRGTERRTATKV